ncbi:TPA: radical SAM protein [Candidatus Poribacteria bacterium]|nr:radical SAM protein [Candidatus Poribacteria bacterium]
MKICEIFYSIQGESTYSGLPCIFVRTSGCNLRCLYCDTKYAYENGFEISVDDIIKKIKTYRCRLVEITGGEPLIQIDEVNKLIASLLADDYEVLLETNGSIDIKSVDQNVVKILDLKCPDSGMSENICWENIKYLTDKDQVKFVLSSRKDYEWAKDIINKHFINRKNEILLSTAYGLLKPADVVQWMLNDSLKVRFQLQIHKYIWHPNVRGV